MLLVPPSLAPEHKLSPSPADSGCQTILTLPFPFPSHCNSLDLGPRLSVGLRLSCSLLPPCPENCPFPNTILSPVVSAAHSPAGPSHLAGSVEVGAPTSSMTPPWFSALLSTPICLRPSWLCFQQVPLPGNPFLVLGPEGTTSFFFQNVSPSGPSWRREHRTGRSLSLADSVP